MGRAEAIDGVIAAWRSRPFVFGSADCCQFAGELVLALTGVDYRSKFPIYAGDEGADELIRAHGGLVQLVEHAFGPHIHPCRAVAGDVVVFTDLRGMESVGVCLGAELVAPGLRGLETHSMARASAAWRI